MKPLRTIMDGDRFGSWVVVRFDPSRKANGHLCWICRCDLCGSTKSVCGSSLGRKSSSCGCSPKTKHGLTHTREYRIWASMIQRCTNPKTNNYHNYGARGIGICPEWRESFLEFYKQVGPAPGPKHEIDRINNDEGYFPGNVRWVTNQEQNNNTRDNIRLSYRGETHTVADWCRLLGLVPFTVYARLKRGHNVADALHIGPLARRDLKAKNHYLLVNGQRMTLRAAAIMFGINIATLRNRLQYGWGLCFGLMAPSRGIGWRKRL